MNDDKYGRLPQAGDFENKDGLEIIYLSPKPIPTGMPAISTKQLHQNSNDVYLDFAVSKASFEFLLRAAIGSLVFLTLFFLISTGFLAWLRRDVEPFLTHWLEYFTIQPIWWFMAIILTMYLHIIYRATKQITKHPPIRFNRHRREVVFVPERGATPKYVHWENVIACVSSGQLITQYAIIPEHKLMIGLRESETGSILWSSVNCLSRDLAISEWEAIRTYVEEGPCALTGQEENEFDAGTPENFHIVRRSYLKNYSLIRYVFGFLLVQFFSGWTLPCYFSNWVNSRPKASFPKDVLEWSKPLPLDQQKKPSEELLEKSASVRTAFSKGQSLINYFKKQASSSQSRNFN